uniref:Kinesin-like protein n=1 Tax=Marsilea vestita TaxID=59764 RepID=A0A142KW93_MARVE|nr:kinesin 4-II protein [Marsilea vestita]
MTMSLMPVLDEAAVRVAVRARPLLEKEIQDHCQECVNYNSERAEITLGKEKRFTFDHVFGPDSSQEEIYLDCVKPLVDSCIAGYNATVVAYGQTGSGKTHTMGSANSNVIQESEMGILPRVIRQLYKSIEEHKNAEFLVKCSFVEIYNEEIKDLLHPETPSKSIFIREDANGDIILAGVREEVVTSFENMMKFLELGSTSRTTGSTLMNQHSSRSHAIYTIIVQQRTIEDCSSDVETITAKFHLVDLAGSERAKRTGAVGARFKESITINSGLLALGNVISALGDERKRGQHVPYRQSKLTRLLQDSLGGNSRTCMIACISTADVNNEETLNTLKYANRARNIHNKPIINRDSRVLQMNQLRQELKNLQEELVTMRLRENETGLDYYKTKGVTADDQSEFLNMNQQGYASQQEILNLTEELQDCHLMISKIKGQLVEAQAQKDQFQLKIHTINREMNSLLQMIPSWEASREILEPAMLFLLQMAKRILADTKGECDGNQIEKGRSASREGKKDDCTNQLKKENSASSNDTPSIMKHYLKTIQVLQKKLAMREQELKEKNNAILEVTSDLARDEKIFSEKMAEIKSLKNLIRDITKEKDCLLQKVQMDASIISNLSQDALVKEGELSRLRASIESLQTQPQDGNKGQQKGFQEFNNKVSHKYPTSVDDDVESKDGREIKEMSINRRPNMTYGGQRPNSEGHAISEYGGPFCTHDNSYTTENAYRQLIVKDSNFPEPNSMCLEKKLHEIALAWHAEKQAMENMVEAERKTWENRAMCAIKKHEQLERDHYALKEELENTKSLMQKAGLGIRLSAQSVRELNSGNMDHTNSITC